MATSRSSAATRDRGVAGSTLPSAVIATNRHAVRSTPTRPREAVTHFEVAELLSGHALLDVRLETGRTHQIRVHLAAIDLPVVGDRVYGVPEPALGRQFLHANRLAFTHPFTNARVEVESPLPDDLAAYLEGLSAGGART